MRPDTKNRAKMRRASMLANFLAAGVGMCNKARMDYLQTIERIEAAATKKEVAMSKLYESAGIAHTTWGRWKRKITAPNHGTWERVETAARELKLLPGRAA